MKKLFLIILLSFNYCYSQNDSLAVRKIRLDSLIEIEPAYPLNEVRNYDLGGFYNDLDSNIEINKEGLYQFENSNLVTADLIINIENIFNRTNDNCTSELDFSFGYLKGNIVEGKKEGEWKKKIHYKTKKGEKNRGYVLVKNTHYANGFLDGKYQVFNMEGKVLHPNLNSKNSSEKIIDYSIFKKGTGNYYDYYYDIGILKKMGYYKEGKKHGTWHYYNKKGELIQAEHYINGVLINDY